MKKEHHLTHLYWRAGFGLSPKEWDKRKGWSIDKAVATLFKDAKKIAPLDDRIVKQLIDEAEIKMKNPEMRSKLRKKGRTLVFQENIEWIKRMASPDHPSLLERMTLFWHGHFACTTKMPHLGHEQLKTIRTHALGNFREFVHAMSKDVSMIRFLNNQQNRKNSPNENFARELMELFTIGRGNYSEQDVKEAARAFTGWRSKAGKFVFKERDHDYGLKTFMGISGDLNGEDIVNALLDKKETARFITEKIYRYFVNENIDEKRVNELASRFYKNKYDIEGLMKAIFSSSWFYDEKNRGTKIKSPIELMAGIFRQLDVDMDDAKSFQFIQKALGQRLFNPPNVAGWPGGKSWIDNSTLMLRLNMVNYLYGKAEVNFKVKDELETQRKGQAFKRIEGTIHFEDLLNAFGEGSQDTIFTQMSAFLLQTKTTPAKSTIDPFVIKGNNEDYIKSLALRLMTLPEYQMC